ncbi:myb family transcription factor EFM-like [Cucurbita moschata]|uniref:Myb family transcription factor EFM-like n=1 Tax=Cucurbita moschata TaxID=3662 RepID=A0A6J1H9M0_CUCMO|nr:myb family transcription factor EFM-like [Cucurbita moschata]
MGSTELGANSDDYSLSYDKLHHFLSRLEEERLKIDVFKRELPLCMQLLTNAVETSRRQLQACKTTGSAAAPVLEEFMPLKNATAAEDEKPETVMSDKANWMTSVQLWSQAGDVSKHQSTINNNASTDHSKLEDCDNNNNNNNSVNCIQRRINHGAFVPFNKDRSSGGEKGAAAKMELLEKGEKNNNKNENNIIDGGVVMAVEQRFENGAAEVGLAPTMSSTTTQTHRKARRCWSPDLHRRFVNALQMLGGSQAATPKQIRELMKVDGLTNDEVKSHLQKYRLHTRRPGPTLQASGPPAAQLVVLGLGGLWVPPEYAAAAGAATPSALYGPPPSSHQASHFYTPHLHHASLQHHHQVQLYTGAPAQVTQSSPESEVRNTAERSESFEEEKSGSSSWRIEGGENGDERIKGRGSCGRRSEEGEESNRSEITLKF